jgi:lipopolysaccharide/colanic/teichoic acid biosynthesis glycosyltransferase
VLKRAFDIAVAVLLLFLLSLLLCVLVTEGARYSRAVLSAAEFSRDAP